MLAEEPLYRVFASARSLQSIAALKEDGIETVQLDVTKEDSIAAAVAHVIDTAGVTLPKQPLPSCASDLDSMLDIGCHRLQHIY